MSQMVNYVFFQISTKSLKKAKNKKNVDVAANSATHIHIFV